MTLTATQTSIGERTAVASTPTFASLEQRALERERGDQQRDREPDAGGRGATARAGQVIVSRAPPSTGRVASHAAPMMPSGLPTTYAAMIPSVTGDVTAADSRSPSSWMPALASANSGTITRLVQGCSRYCSRSLGEIAEARLARAE